MIKICYTAMCGNFDDPKPVLRPTPGWRYIFFTDDPKLKVEGWEMKVISDNNSPKLKAKSVKILPHKHLPPHDISLWIDASYQIIGSLESIYKPFSDDYDIGLTLHNEPRKTVYEESETILKYGLDTAENVNKTLDKYREEGFVGNYEGKFYKAGMIIRRNSEPVNEFNQTWWSEIQRGSSRDQLSLTYALEKHKLRVYKTAQLHIDMMLKWYHHNKEIKNIFFIQPYGFHLKIGDRLNYEIDRMPDDAWICLTDQDTCFLTPKVGDLLNSVILRYPDTDLFGAYTNRVGLGYQKWEEVDPENFDMLYHHKIAEEKVKKYYSTCSVVSKPIAGFFMLFPKKTWENHKFQSEIIMKKKSKILPSATKVYFDWAFSEDILNAGGTIRLINGLYIFHAYRMGGGPKDVKHLTTVV